MECLWQILQGVPARALRCRPLFSYMTEICRTARRWQRPCLTACLQGDSLKTSIQLDFGDGIRITYSNLSRTDDGIRHIYRATGIYRVVASAENEQGSDSSMLFLHITSTAKSLVIPTAAAIAWTSCAEMKFQACNTNAVQITKRSRALNIHRLWLIMVLKCAHVGAFACVNICVFVLPQVWWSACISLLRL